MPSYIYKHPDKEEYKEVVQGMNDKHEYFEDGIKWKRVFTVPKAAIDTNINPFSEKEFREKTNKKGKYGDLLDLSGELSEKRKDKEGIDPVRRKFYDDYSKARKGRKHQEEKKEIAKEKLKHIAQIEF